MSFSSWVDARVQTAIQTGVPDLVKTLLSSDGPLIQSIITGVVTQVANDTQLVQNVASAVTAGVLNELTSKIESIPGDVSTLMGNELNNLPGQIKDVIDIPAEVTSAVASALVGLPGELVQAIKGILPFGEAEK
jgi:hypothetical protein